MTGIKQIRALTKVGCREAVQEIERNSGQPLSINRLKEHLETALGQGFVGRVIALAELADTQLTPDQTTRLVNRCLELEWVADTFGIEEQGILDQATREKLIRAYVVNGYTRNAAEAAALLGPGE